MAEPYRAALEVRPRWVLTCWPRVSAWPVVIALAVSVPCAVLGWQGEPEAQVLSCVATAPLAQRCSVTSGDSPLSTHVESCEQLPARLPTHAPLTHRVVMRPRYEPFVANDMNVFIAGAPAVIARPLKGTAHIAAPNRLDVSTPTGALAACTDGASQSIDIEIHRRILYLLAAPLLALAVALRWMISKRMRVVLDAGERTARVGSSSVALDETTRPGWIRLGDTEHRGELDDATTRRRLARWLVARLG